ncbi:MAG: hypothetical protein U1D26_02550 [Patescibacteria group bacterium]|nr:hypothetical protein [Patescibacteria group bacterium]
MLKLHNPSVRAFSATGVFAIAGILGFLYAPSTHFVWPDALFYAIILINTFFSIRFFTRITPPSRAQNLIDAALVVSYLALAFSLGHEWAFIFFALVVFIMAPIKYVLMLGVVPMESLLKKKLLIDLAGTVMCAAALIGAVLLDYPLTSAWAMAIIFTLANIYLLAIRPMYRL